jgi:hypothetical protein
VICTRGRGIRHACYQDVLVETHRPRTWFPCTRIYPTVYCRFGDIGSGRFFLMVATCCHSSINVLYQVISNHSTSITVLYRMGSDSADRQTWQKQSVPELLPVRKRSGYLVIADACLLCCKGSSSAVKLQRQHSMWTGGTGCFHWYAGI